MKQGPGTTTFLELPPKVGAPMSTISDMPELLSETERAAAMKGSTKQ